MKRRAVIARTGLLLSVFAAGISTAYVFPFRSTCATTTSDRNESMLMATFPFTTTRADTSSPLDGVVAIDLQSGLMRGALLNPATRHFDSFYTRDLVKDFQVEGDPKFSFVTGHAQMKNDAGMPKMGAGIIYVPEWNSGKIAAYAIVDDGIQVGVKPFIPIDAFKWRDQKE
jgi:hypothetical protein